MRRDNELLNEVEYRRELRRVDVVAGKILALTFVVLSLCYSFGWFA